MKGTKFIAFCGAVLLIIGTFLPLADSNSLMNNSHADGSMMIAVAVTSFLLAAAERVHLEIWTGFAALALLLNALIGTESGLILGWGCVVILIATVLLLSGGLVATPDITSQSFHDWAQGVFAVAGIVAIVLGGWLYIAERRDKPRVVLQPSAAVVGVTPEKNSERRLEAVLLQFSIAIENRGARPLIFNCPAIDLFGLSGQEDRDPTYTDDLEATSLLPAVSTSPNWAKCVHEFEESRREDERQLFNDRKTSGDWVNPPQPTPEPQSGARYRDFFMESGDITTKTWEQRVRCDFDAVRIIFKLPKPNSTHDYETKILVPIADVCANKRNVSILHYAPIAPGVQSEVRTREKDSFGNGNSSTAELG